MGDGLDWDGEMLGKNGIRDYLTVLFSQDPFSPLAWLKKLAKGLRAICNDLSGVKFGVSRKVLHFIVWRIRSHSSDSYCNQNSSSSSTGFQYSFVKIVSPSPSGTGVLVAILNFMYLK